MNLNFFYNCWITRITECLLAHSHESSSIIHKFNFFFVDVLFGLVCMLHRPELTNVQVVTPALYIVQRSETALYNK